MCDEQEVPKARREHLAREKMLYLYTSAFELGDIEKLAAIWQQAAHDPTLEALLLEMNQAYQCEEELSDQLETEIAPAANSALSAFSQFEPLASGLHSHYRQAELLQDIPEKEIYQMQQVVYEPTPEQPHRRHTFQRRLGLLAAVIFIALLVGSLATVLNLAHQKPSTRTASSPPIPGHVVYRSPQQPGTLIAPPAWSADSKFLAVSSETQIEIWDATTGQQKTTIPFASFLAWSSSSDLLAVSNRAQTEIWDATTGQQKTTIPLTGSLVWSPSGDQLAIASSSSITVVNGKTITSYAYPALPPPGSSGAIFAPGKNPCPAISR